MKINHYYNPVRMVFGSGSVKELSALVREAVPEQAHILALVWSEKAVAHPVFAALQETCCAGRVTIRIFQASNPTVQQLFELYQATRAEKPDLIVAMGGGSVMDIGKTLCLINDMELSSVEELRGIIAEKQYSEPKTRWIGIPTTAGTGSETTCWATIWDPEQDMKRSAESKHNYAFAAVVDPELSAEMPKALAAASALDAAAHGMESYWAKASNTVSRTLALAGIKCIMSHIDGLLAGDGTAHTFMAKGSMLTGLAFSNTKTTACHSISYPLTMEYHIPHGAAVSMLMGPVLMLNYSLIGEPEPLLKALGIHTPEELSGRIKGILAAAGLSNTLSGWQIPKEALPRLASLGMTKGRADNNPAELSEELIEKILNGIYE